MQAIRSRFSSLTEGLPPTYWLLWLGTLINRLGGFVIPFLTLYLTQQRGIAVSQAALMVSLFGAGSFIAQLSGGEFTDRLGRRPVMLMSFLITPVATVALGLVHNLLWIGFWTLLVGFFTDLYRPAVGAAITDLVAPEVRTRAFGYNYWAINLGAAIAPVVAGLLARSNYLTLFIGDALTTLAFGLIVLFKVRETRPAEARHTAHTSMRERISQVKREPILMLFSLLTLFFGTIYMQGNVTLPVDMLSHGLGPDAYGLAIAVNGLLIVLISIQVSNLAIRWPRFGAMAAAAMFLGLGFGFTAFANNLPLFALSVAIWTIGEILGATVAPVIIADLAPVELRGLYQGIFGSMWGLSLFVGPAIGGWVYQYAGATTLWTASFVIGCVLAVCYLAMSGAALRRLKGNPGASSG
jgi:MFS family permease